MFVDDGDFRDHASLKELVEDNAIDEGEHFLLLNRSKYGAEQKLIAIYGGPVGYDKGRIRMSEPNIKLHVADYSETRPGGFQQGDPFGRNRGHDANFMIKNGAIFNTVYLNDRPGTSDNPKEHLGFLNVDILSYFKKEDHFIDASHMYIGIPQILKGLKENGYRQEATKFAYSLQSL